MCGARISQTCPNCNLPSPLDYRFCGHCGLAFALTIEKPETMETLPEEVSYSIPDETGPELETTADTYIQPAPGALSGERRQATVLIADVKGSTQILEQIGTEIWVQVMNQVLQIMSAAIYRFGGIVDQFRGDGLVAFFGARLAHEDDSERAVLAALVMQDELKIHAAELVERYNIHLLVRVGVNTGEVITTNIGIDTQHREDTAMGAAVTLAARLEAAAEPGTVLVSENTYRLVESHFKWKYLGEIPIRGLAQPVAVYRPIGPAVEADQESRLQTLGLWIPMVGRDRELASIDQCVANLRQGIGGIALISGEAGMGKSRLIFEARLHVERDAALLADKNYHPTWLQGRCRSYGQTLPDSMWVDMWQRWLGRGHWVSQEEALERLQSKAVEFWGDRFDEYYPYLAAFLSLPLEEPYAGHIRHLDAEGLRQRFFIAVRSWLEIMARQNPLVIVFTEVHWADETSLELLKFCLPLCMQERALFVVVFRPERTAPVWNFKHFVETEYAHRLAAVNLLPLTESQSFDLIQRMIGPDALSEHALAQIIEKSSGNPYYLTELIRSLIDRGALKRDVQSGKWQTSGGEIPLSLPDSLKSLLMARIDSLSLKERRVLQLAAVIGSIFWFNVLERLVNHESNLQEQLADMQRLQLIAERGVLPDLGREYAFNSNMIREAAYDSILSSQREDLHRYVANILEQIVTENILKQYHGLIAYHYRQAGDCEKDLFHTILAAQEAQRIHANAEAIQAFQHAFTLMDQAEELECIPSDESLAERKLEVLRGLGQILFGIGKVQEAERQFRAAISIGRQMGLPPHELTRLFYWLGETLFWRNAFDEPIHLGEEGLELLGGYNESVEVALMNQLVAVGSSQLGDHDKFIDFTLRTAGFIQRLPYSVELRPAFDHIITLYGYSLKNVPEARRWLEVLKQKAEEYHDLRALGEYYEYSGGLSFQEGNTQDAIANHQKAIEQFSQIGDLKHLSRAWKSLGVCRLQTGEIDESLECFNHALETAKVFANEADYAIGYWSKGQALLCLGAWQEALASFEKAGTIVHEVPFLQEEWALSGIGRAYLAQGLKKEALETFQAALQYAPITLFRSPYQAIEILSALEQSYENAADFRSYIEHFRQEHPEVHTSLFKQWYLEPRELGPVLHEPRHHEVFKDSLASNWEWVDPFMDCSKTIRHGLTIQAANERNLHHINRSTPRLLRQEPIWGDFTIQAVCQPASESKPAIGGLLVWLSDKYWFCLEIGGRGVHEIALRGFMNNSDFVFGRGQLKVKKPILRLERRGHWLSAYCSGSGKNWFYAGGCELSTGEPLRLGVHAIGHINRMVYPEANNEGTAVQFKEFWLWGN
jgi:class 3 adenylate cyclase/tetratricopeptide (TPR) repeat protein